MTIALALVIPTVDGALLTERMNYRFVQYSPICLHTGWAKKPDYFLKCITFLYNDLGRQSIYQTVPLFIRSKNDILNAAVFKYFLHKVRETTLH